MTERKPAVSVPLNHVNPVETYYFAGARCFTCPKGKELITTDGHPSFDIFIYGDDPKDVKRARDMFRRQGVRANLHIGDGSYWEPGGTLDSCQEHELGLRALQRTLFEARAITTKAVKDALSSQASASSFASD